MGTYSYLRLAGEYYFYAVRESYALELAAIFNDNELTPEDDTYAYELPAWQLRSRLDLLGFTHDTSYNRIANAYEPQLAEDPSTEPIEVWLVGVQYTVTQHREETFDEPPEWTNVVDVRYLLRLVLEILPSDTKVALDISELVTRGFIAATGDFCASAFAELHLTSASHAPLIVLTEGSTDAEFLTVALNRIYPHLEGYVAFPDFQYKADAGAPGLVKTIRAFAASKIRARVVALFDNDSGAREALSPLDRTTLPPNIQIKQLPVVDWAKSYPTVGPSGVVELDVNGLACSIEFFFGTSLLRRTDGSLTPVQWNGYIPKLGAYQGALMEKRAVQDRFRLEAANASASSIDIRSEPWSSMKILLDELLPIGTN